MAALTSLAMIAFTGFSLLCRFAVMQTNIVAASFTVIRVVSGLVTLAGAYLFQDRARRLRSMWARISG